MLLVLIEINGNNYSSFIKENKYSLVLFKTKTCRICMSLTPILELLEEELNFKLKIGVIDVSVYNELIDNLYLTSIPTLILHNKNNGETSRLTGLHNLEELVTWTKKYMI